MQEDDFCTVWVGLLIICLYPADDVRVSISWPTELVISLLHHREHLVLRSPVMATNTKYIVYMIRKSVEVCAKVLKFMLSLAR